MFFALSAALQKLIKKLIVGSPEKPNGITLYDPDGNPYCVRIELSGVLASATGECGAQQSQPSSAVSQNSGTVIATSTTETTDLIGSTADSSTLLTASSSPATTDTASTP